MKHYTGNESAIRELVRDAEVHRDVYVDAEIFDIEMERLFPSAWIYIGHASQIPSPGDFITATVGSADMEYMFRDLWSRQERADVASIRGL
jgi:hypothetical protein